jgi:hypothetical protein
MAPEGWHSNRECFGIVRVSKLLCFRFYLCWRGGPDDSGSERTSSEKEELDIAEGEGVDEPNLAIRDLTIDIIPGEKVALCGRSGR